MYNIFKTLSLGILHLLIVFKAFVISGFLLKQENDFGAPLQSVYIVLKMPLKKIFNFQFIWSLQIEVRTTITKWSSTFKNFHNRLNS